jgi:hypothetical protein
MPENHVGLNDAQRCRSTIHAPPDCPYGASLSAETNAEISAWKSLGRYDKAKSLDDALKPPSPCVLVVSLLHGCS